VSTPPPDGTARRRLRRQLLAKLFELYGDRYRNSAADMRLVSKWFGRTGGRSETSGELIYRARSRRA